MKLKDYESEVSLQWRGWIAAILIGCGDPTPSAPTTQSSAPSSNETRELKVPSSSMMPTLKAKAQIRVAPAPKTVARGDVIVYRFPCGPSREFVRRVIAIGGDTVEVRCTVVFVNGAPIASRLVEGESCVYQDFDELKLQWVERTCSRYHEQLGGASYDTFQDREHLDHLRLSDQRDFPQRDTPPPSCSEQTDDPIARARPVGTMVETKPAAGTDPCEPQVHFVVPQETVFVLGDNRTNSNDSRFWGVVPIELVTGLVKP